MNLTNEDKKTLIALQLEFIFAVLKNAANLDVETFKFDFDLKTCLLLEKVIYDVLGGKCDEV